MEKDGLKEQLANVFSCDPAELDGANIFECLEDAEKAGATVYWGSIDADITETSIF